MDKSFSTGLHQKVGNDMTGFILVFDVIIFNAEARENYACNYHVELSMSSTK